jgi:hypothetical protein
MRRPFNYANVAATLALVFSMSGGALAARHYLITSTKQIKPSVLKKLRGAKGARGRRGARGPTGLQGKEGVQGKEGPRGLPGSFPATLPAGQTLTGAYNVEGTNPTGAEAVFAGGSISFHFALTSAPQNRFLKVGEHTTECPGSVGEPKAQPGWLCVYEEESKNQERLEVGPSTRLYARYGDFISLESTKKAGGFFSTGTWAVTGD